MRAQTLYATLRIRRRPISNAIVCLKLRVSFFLPVHKNCLEEMDVSDRASPDEIGNILAELQTRYNCNNVEIDANDNVLALVNKNAKLAVLA